MKKIVIAFGSVVASLALLVSVTEANQVCGFLIDQPKLPKSVQSLRRF